MQQGYCMEMCVGLFQRGRMQALALFAAFVGVYCEFPCYVIRRREMNVTWPEEHNRIKGLWRITSS